MKVCTDSCLFGAWVADSISIQPKKILDIGTGTGLLALMLAQKFAAPADALEIDASAAKQAAVNFSHSPWEERMKVIHSSVQNYQSSANYDLIISNPPFFEDDLKSVNPVRNAAMHDTALNLDTLLENIIRLGEPEEFHSAILIPAAREEYFIKTAIDKGLFVHRIMRVRQTPNHSYFRAMILLGNGKDDDEILTEEMSIKDENGNYSANFIQLLKAYYLHL